MKTSTLLAIGAGTGLLLYLRGKSVVTDMCMKEASTAQADPAAACALTISNHPKLGMPNLVRLGAISLWRPINADDIG